MSRMSRRPSSRDHRRAASVTSAVTSKSRGAMPESQPQSRAPMAPDDPFERIGAAGRQAVLGGEAKTDAVPVEGGRWGLSIVLLPPPPLGQALDKVTGDVMAALGGEDWGSGRLGRAH